MEMGSKQLTPQEVNNKLLLDENKYGQTAWHLAAACGNIQALVKLWEYTKDPANTRGVQEQVAFSQRHLGKDRLAQGSREGQTKGIIYTTGVG
jgi:ankyrin repeat protein